jgi:hypothetical protein
VPNGQHHDLVAQKRVVDVVTRASQKDASCAADRRSAIWMSDVGCRPDEGERGFEFVDEQVRRGGSMSSPP